MSAAVIPLDRARSAGSHAKPEAVRLRRDASLEPTTPSADRVPLPDVLILSEPTRRLVVAALDHGVPAAAIYLALFGEVR